MVTPDEAIEAIRGTGGAQPGCRALHAKGTLYRGTFTANPEAAGLSRAKPLDGSTVPALARFSNGSGNPSQRDGVPGVRGLAVKFTLPDGSTTDVSTQTARLFVSSPPDGFVDLLKAMRPGPTTPLRMAKYFLTHPRLFGALPVLRDANKVPTSYATIEYHGLHAFRWIAADGQSTQIATVGTLEIDGLDTQREHGDDIVVFDPLRVTAGIEPSDDPVLHFRSLAYSASVKLRTGVDRGPEAPHV